MRNPRRRPLSSTLSGLVLVAGLFFGFAPDAGATIVSVVINGEVEFNQINPGQLGMVSPQAPASITFDVDSDVFVNSTQFSTRGYPIVAGTFSMTLGTVTMGLQSPFPAGVTPYLSIRNNDPGVDGFMLTDSIDFPNGVPLAQTGIFGQFKDNFYVTYSGTTLPSLDVLDALGTFAFVGLSVFNWTITDGPFDAMGLIFEDITLSTGPAPELFVRGDCNGDAGNNIADAIYLLSVLFPPVTGPPVPGCDSACDGNDDGAVNIADAIAVLNSLFGAPPAPLPAPNGACGEDSANPDSLSCTTQSAC